jgi:hypothetical protein
MAEAMPEGCASSQADSGAASQLHPRLAHRPRRRAQPRRKPLIRLARRMRHGQDDRRAAHRESAAPATARSHDQCSRQQQTRQKASLLTEQAQTHRCVRRPSSARMSARRRPTGHARHFGLLSAPVAAPIHRLDAWSGRVSDNTNHAGLDRSGCFSTSITSFPCRARHPVSAPPASPLCDVTLAGSMLRVPPTEESPDHSEA